MPCMLSNALNAEVLLAAMCEREVLTIMRKESSLNNLSYIICSFFFQFSHVKKSSVEISNAQIANSTDIK